MSTSINADRIEHTPAQRALETAGRVLVQFPERFTYWGGAVLVFIGSVEVIGALGKSQVLDMPDPLFGVPFHYLMLVIGIIQLATACLLLFTNWRTAGLGLAAWIAANFLFSRVGLWNMGWHQSSGFMADALGLSLGATDAITSLLSTFLLIGSCAALWIERRLAQAAASLKISCPSSGGHIKFSIQNLGRKIPCPHCQTAITLRKPENLKISCFFCKEHIEFPGHAIGEKLKCPHCKMDITLKEPA